MANIFSLSVLQLQVNGSNLSPRWCGCRYEVTLTVNAVSKNWWMELTFDGLTWALNLFTSFLRDKELPGSLSPPLRHKKRKLKPSQMRGNENHPPEGNINKSPSICLSICFSKRDWGFHGLSTVLCYLRTKTSFFNLMSNLLEGGEITLK